MRLPLTSLVAVWLVKLGAAIRIDPFTAAERRSERQLLGQEAPSRRTKVNVDVPSSPDGHLVEELPLWSGPAFPTDQWAGHLPADETGNKYFFYWLFAPDTSDVHKEDSEIPLIIWLNGGPGCSSMDGLWLENGPFRLRQGEYGDYHVTTDEYSWHKAPAYTLYIDQPVGTGLSFTTNDHYPSNDEEVNIDFYYFLQSFFKLHADKFVTDKKVHRPLFFSGESHAGHYIPSMLNYILRQNAELAPGNLEIPVSGAAIGNGWTDPTYQYAAAEAAYGHGMVSLEQINTEKAREELCRQRLLAGDYTPSVCFSLLNTVVASSLGSGSGYKVSTYDARLIEARNGPRNFPPGHHVVETYLGGWELKFDTGTLDKGIKTAVLKAIHATAATDAGQRFAECTDPPYDALEHQDGLGVVPDVVEVLEHRDGVRLLFFNGMEDLICNHVGNERWIESMEWKHRLDWIRATRYAWRAETEEEGRVSGYMKEYENLMFLKILSAGHMVPLDVPPTSLSMMRTFVYGGSFETHPQDIAGSEAQQQQQCPACPVCKDCPVCPAPESSDHPAGAPTTHHTTDGGFQVNSSGVIAGLLAIAGAIGVVAFFALRGRRRPRREVVSQYDMELQESHYSDEPEQNGSIKRNGII